MFFFHLSEFFVSLNRSFVLLFKEFSHVMGILMVFAFIRIILFLLNRNFVLLAKMFKEFSHVMEILFLISKLLSVKVNFLPSQKFSFCNRNLVPISVTAIIFLSQQLCFWRSTFISVIRMLILLLKYCFCESDFLLLTGVSFCDSYFNLVTRYFTT